MWQFLFDLDGTILDTTELILNSFVHAFREGLGETVTEDELMVHFGRPLETQFRVMRPRLEDADIHRLVQIYRQHNETEHDRFVAVVPGADKGLRALYDKGFPLGIVTSKRLDLTEHGLRQFGLLDLFQVVVHMDSTPRHKPHPEPVQHALSLMGGRPEQAAYVGDSPYDMTSGKEAGVRTLGLIYNTFTDAVLRETGADVTIHRWSEIVETWLGWAEGEPQPHS